MTEPEGGEEDITEDEHKSCLKSGTTLILYSFPEAVKAIYLLYTHQKTRTQIILDHNIEEYP